MNSKYLFNDHSHSAAHSQQKPEQLAAPRAQQPAESQRSARLAASRGAQRAPQRAAAQSVVSPPGAALLGLENGPIQQKVFPPSLHARPQQPMRVAVDVDEGWWRDVGAC